MKNLTAQDNQEINENQIREKAQNQDIPITDMSSIANGFSFLTSYSVLSPDADSLQRRIEKKKLMENLFIDDLKTFLRLCISVNG